MNDVARRALLAAGHVLPQANADGLAAGVLALPGTRRFRGKRDPARAETDPVRAGQPPLQAATELADFR